MLAGPYNGGPGGPILVVTNSANAFTEYYAEILLTEGLNCFALRDISTVSNATLAAYDVVILGETALTTAQVTTFSNWVNSGGHLIAMRPDKKLASLLGLTDTGATLSEGYLRVNTTNGPGVGIVGETMQYHGTADRYTLGSAASLATLYSNATNATVNPAVTFRSVGSNGGQVAAFTYDLARSIVYTRQGNPAWAGQERDGQTPMRSDDLFFGAASSDPQPDWINLNKVAIPQADEQQRLLANLILSMESDKNLLPRFWYFPHGYEAVVVMTGDDHASLYGGSYAVRRFNQYLAASPPGASVDDWTAPRCTAYIFISPTPSLTNNAQVVYYQTNGFEINVHLTTDCTDYTPTQMATYFTNQLNQLKAKYPSVAAPVTHRIHCIAWSGYTAPAEVSRQFGIRLETSYYYWPPGWVNDRPGFMTGSGMPMRFATTSGNVVDVYQATTQMTDESGQSYPYTIDTLLDRALGSNGYYGAFVANIHTDADSEPGADAIFASAVSRGVPIISARQMLTWLDARNQSSITNIHWAGSKQTFSVTANASAKGLQAMVPVPVGYSITNITWNGGTTTNYYLRQVKGIPYAHFPATNGNYEISYALDTTPPTVTSNSPANGALEVRLDAKVSITFSEGMNASTINTNTILLRDPVNAPVLATVSYDASAFTATLTPVTALAPATTYTVIVSGGAGGVSDLATNLLASDFVSGFTTTSRHPASIGNDSEGAYLDNLWYGGAWINACRFQAVSNMTVTGMEAKVATISGHYKCAIYSDNSGKMNRLLRGTVEVSNPGNGWQAFPLTSALSLTNNSYYWLAIWSDDADAAVYYSDTEGTLSWLKTNYSNWPDPISATNGGSLNYCIYAYGATGPVASDLVVGLLEDTGTNLTLLGGGGPVSYAILSNPTNGTLGTLNTNTGAVAYTPNTNYFGADSFRYRVSLGGQQATGTVSITVSAVNDAPTLTLASNNVVVLEDSGVVTLTGFATTSVGPANESGQSITNIGVLSVSNAALFAVGPAISAGGTLTFTPVANGNGVAMVMVQARDNGGTANGGVNDSVVRGFTITIMAVNDAPIAYSQSVTSGEHTSFGITLAGSDVDGPVTNYVVLAGPTHGTLSGVTPNLTYCGASNYFGADSFTYSVNDGSLTSAVATVTITLTNINDVPVAFDQSVTNGEDTSFGITLAGSDVDGPVTNYVVLAGPTNGTLSGVAPDLVYRGTTNYYGTDSFTFSVNDGSLTSGIATVTIVLTNINDAPVALSQSVTNGEDTSFGITLAGSDVDGPVTSYVVLAGPTNGTLSGVAPGLVYRGATNYFGADSFTFGVNDGSLTSAVATVTITLTNINDAPVAFDQGVTNGEDTSFGITLAGSDVDGPVTNYVVLAGPTHGTLSGVTPNLTYCGASNYFGADSFTYSVNDGSLTSGVATVTIVLTNINDAPIAYSQSVTNGEDTSFGITLAGSDVDGPETNYVILAGPTNGTLSGVAPDLVYCGTTNYYGTDSFTFGVNDGSLTSGVATVTIVLTNVNDAPMANDDSYVLGSGVVLEVAAPGVLSNDSDLEGESLTAVLVSGPLQGILELNPSGGFSYTPTNHFSGADTFTYRSSDGEAESGLATVSVGVSNPIEILSVGVTNNQVMVTWTSIVGKGYRLQYKDSWADGGWTDILPEVIASGPAAIGTNAADAVTQRIYRVKCLGE